MGVIRLQRPLTTFEFQKMKMTDDINKIVYSIKKIWKTQVVREWSYKMLS